MPTPELRSVWRDDQTVYQGRCPKCGAWQDLDDDQLHGRVSSACDIAGCDFHETLRWLPVEVEA